MTVGSSRSTVLPGLGGAVAPGGRDRPGAPARQVDAHRWADDPAARDPSRHRGRTSDHRRRHGAPRRDHPWCGGRGTASTGVAELRAGDLDRRSNAYGPPVPTVGDLLGVERHRAQRRRRRRPGRPPRAQRHRADEGSAHGSDRGWHPGAAADRQRSDGDRGRSHHHRQRSSAFGAAILKAAAYLADSRDSGRHVEDAAVLLAAIDDPFVERRGLAGSDSSRLRVLEGALPEGAREWRRLPEPWRTQGQAALRILLA